MHEDRDTKQRDVARNNEKNVRLNVNHMHANPQSYSYSCTTTSISGIAFVVAFVCIKAMPIADGYHDIQHEMEFACDEKYIFKI